MNVQNDNAKSEETHCLSSPVCPPREEVKIYTILTEEVPLPDEINFILKQICNISTTEYYKVSPLFEDNIFKGEWTIDVLESMNIRIIIKLFKSETSCVDYLVFNGEINETTSAGDALCALESTKTNDNSSRNTAVNQRITKFMVFNKMFPSNNTKLIMFYNKKWQKKMPSKTAILGLRLMKSLQIESYHGENNVFENLYDFFSIHEFLSINELITEKNQINEKKGNVSVKIDVRENEHYISCKLDKGNSINSGKISHDPNVGLLTGLINFIYNKNNDATVVIQKHNISQTYFDKSLNNKFWYAVNDINISFENINNITRPAIPTKYFTLERNCTEKQSTILFSQIINKNYQCIFSNHSGCALTNVKTKNEDKFIERTMPRPDILFYNKNENELIIVEGKIEKNIKDGIMQLTDLHLERFIKLIRNEYPECVIKKGLCITIDSIENLPKYESLQFPVLFALDAKGAYWCNL